MSYYRPNKSQREQPPPSAKCTALLFIDTQVYNCDRNGTMYQSLTEEEQKDESVQYYFNQIDTRALSNWKLLQETARRSRVEIIYTVIQSLTRDGRDRGLDYKISGFHVPPGSKDAQVLDAIKPEDDEIILPKTSSSVFSSTILDYLLRSLGVTHLYLCGCVTDQCVEHAARDACDLGYLVTVVTDGCVTYSEQRQHASLNAINGYCRQRTTIEIMEEMKNLQCENE